MKPTLALLFLLATQLLATDAELPIDPSDDFSPGLFMIALAAIGVALLLIGCGIVVAAVMAISAAALAGLGIVSSAVLFGMLRRRVSSGLRAFHYQVFALVGVPAGIGVLWLGSYLAGSQLGIGEVVIMGSVAGVGSGLALAFLFDRLAGALYRRFAADLPDRTPKP